MPLHYSFDDDFLRFTVEGDVDFEQGMVVLRGGLDEALRRAAGAPWPVLFDIRASEERRGAEELKGIAAVLSGHLGAVAAHCAVVVSTPLYYGVSRMFGHFVEERGITMEIFDSVEAAETWLRERTQSE